MIFSLLLQTAALPSEGWPLVQGIMVTLTTIGVAWIARTVFCLRDDVRDLKNTVGTDGNSDGLKWQVADIDKRLRAMERRNIELDAVAEAERQQYQGPERRWTARRLRDHLLPEIPPVDRGEGEEDL